ncbi:hypothetical protein Nepgr_011914 [Nepenthes gracilis]|uniref:Uncharacterized protein n=1 Tax=Nepenthes gracilis TaxID=150966 RepID=A0AAD3SF56_NEPGR|nr:hypothetical protein Nepgr_011914 [Nepenthes gracilis]
MIATFDTSLVIHGTVAESNDSHWKQALMKHIRSAMRRQQEATHASIDDVGLDTCACDEHSGISSTGLQRLLLLGVESS